MSASPAFKISSLHDDLLWPKVSHESGLGEFIAEGVRAPNSELSPLIRTAQFGVDPSAFDLQRLARRGDGYEQYGQLVAESLERGYETVVAAIYDRYGIANCPGPDSFDADAMEQSVLEAVRNHVHLGIPLVRSDADVAGGQVNVVLGVEGMDFVRSLATLETLLDGGVRVFALQYNHSNALADIETGLTELGRAVVLRILDSGAILDLAHSAPVVRTQVLDIGIGYRVTYSHGSTLEDAVPEVASRAPNRFLSPAEVRRTIAGGGIIGLTPSRPFFTSLEKFAERIDAICQEAGHDRSVALGTDFGGIWSGMMLPEIQCVADLVRIGDMLTARHNFTEDQVRRVLCSNATDWMRMALI